MSPPSEQLIRDYLNKVSVAGLSRLSSAERRHLLARTRESIEREVGTSGAAPAGQVASVLAALGEPEALVEQAGRPPAPAGGGSASGGPASARQGAAGKGGAPQRTRQFTGPNARSGTWRPPAEQDAQQPRDAGRRPPPGASAGPKRGRRGAGASDNSLPAFADLAAESRRQPPAPPGAAVSLPVNGLASRAPGPLPAAANRGSRASPAGPATAVPPPWPARRSGQTGYPGEAPRTGPAGQRPPDGRAPDGGAQMSASSRAPGATAAERAPSPVASAPRRVAAAAWALARQHPLEASVLILLGPGTFIYPPAWLLAAVLAVLSKTWDGRDKWAGLAGPVVMVAVGAWLDVLLGGSRASAGAYAAEAWHFAAYVSRVAALLGAIYLTRRLLRGRRQPAVPPWNRHHLG